ncbi:hypothetical protein [Parabacteroides johnsonii]|uniref:hypothetical protein n=2 Tax=Parabacteroides johnsonii TaxID=387661 RepID=UPI00242E2B99|nr:hypothetical protein [Parabacteroides johnsonii]
MEIKRGNTVVCDVYLKDNSYTVEEIMGEDTLTLNFLSRNVIKLQINDYIDFEGTKYKIRHNEKVTKRETSLGWEYTVMFYSSKYDLLDVEFFLHGRPERKKNFDYYTGTARDWLELFVKNMNRSGSGWIAGSCIKSRMITLSFKDKKVGTVLDELIKELDSEYWISGQTMNIGRREYSSNGLVLAQGEGMGFTELEVSAVDDTPPITVLYPYGSDKNLGSDYGADYLLLPDGRLSIEKNVEKYGRIEKSMQFDHIFPKGEFAVTEKIDDYTLRASGMDFNLTDCLLDGVEVIVTFQDGGLAGYDLAIVEDSWDKDLKQFKLKQNDQENALKVPGDINFSVGDKFILTGLKMPQSYRDNASLQLQEEAQAWLDGKCEKRIQLRGKCDEIVFRLQNIFIACGQMVGVYSEQLDIDREIRVTKVKRYIEKDGTPSYRYELTLSDFLESNGFKDLVDDVNKMPEEIEDAVKPVREHTKRSWRDVMETLGMMFDPEGDYFTELIKPLAVHTAQLIVGTNSQQMELIGVKFIPNADNDANYFKNTAGKLVHFTVSEEIREWVIPSASFRLNNSLAYYVYAKCPKEGGNGSIYVSERQIKLEDETGYYHFWVGVLNTPEEGVRSWLPNYGYTEIAGQTITTGLIKDKLARLVIDLVNGTITGPVIFKSGTSGYNNISDRPNLQPLYDGINDALTEAENASNAANNAQSTANNKARVFYQTTAPTSGMRTNDLWVDGVNIYRYSGSSWVLASKYDNTITEINGGLITTGAIAFGNTGGMAASGTIRIWSGGAAGANGQPPTDPTFSVDSSGNVVSNGTITANDAILLRNGQAGITGYGTSNSSIRFWAGGAVPESADFRVDQSGDVNVRMLNAISINGGTSNFSSIYLADKSWNNNYVNLFAAREAQGMEIQKTYQGVLDNIGKFIVMKYNPDATAYREISFFVRHFKSDISWLFRTCIKASQLPSLVQINDLDTSGTKYNVKWDSATGLLYIE